VAGLVEGKVALVTGAGGGIGRASAEIFAREGARGVVVVDVNKDGGEETVAGIRSARGTPTTSTPTCPTRTESLAWCASRSTPTVGSTARTTTPA